MVVKKLRNSEKFIEKASPELLMITVSLIAPLNIVSIQTIATQCMFVIHTNHKYKISSFIELLHGESIYVLKTQLITMFEIRFVVSEISLYKIDMRLHDDDDSR